MKPFAADATAHRADSSVGERIRALRQRHEGSVWTAHAFSAVLSGVALAVYIASPTANAWVPAFICFLPMAFFFAADSHKRTRDHIRSLEARIRLLEAQRPAA